MAKIKPDKIIMSSLMPGFGYVDPPISTSMTISGSVPDGGRDYIKTISVPSGVLWIPYYSIGSYTTLYTLDGSPYSALDPGAGNDIVKIYVSVAGTTCTLRVYVQNSSGTAHTVPTQTVNFTLYLFKSLF